jgi:hypothetical protein
VADRARGHLVRRRRRPGTSTLRRSPRARSSVAGRPSMAARSRTRRRCWRANRRSC